MSEQTPQPVIPQKWSVGKVKDEQIAFDCSKCKEQYKLDAKAFRKKAKETIEGLTKTDKVVRRSFGGSFLSLIVALFVYYYAHRWINGSDVPLNQGMFIPIFIAVAAYTLVKPALSFGFGIGAGIPIYKYTCLKCQTDIFLASNGDLLALPEKSPEDGLDEHTLAFYQTTQKVWSSGKLSSLNAAYENEGKMQLGDFIRKYPAASGNAFEVLFKEYQPCEGEFLVGCSPSWFVLTNLRLIQFDGMDKKFREIVLADVDSYQINPWKSLLAFKLKSGEEINFKKVSYMPSEAYVAKVISGALAP